MNHSNSGFVAVPGYDVDMGPGVKAYVASRVVYKEEIGEDDVPLAVALEINARKIEARNQPVSTIPFTALITNCDGVSFLAQVKAASSDEALMKSRLIGAETSEAALKLEMRDEDPDKDALRDRAWNSAVEKAFAEDVLVSLWIGRHTEVPQCPPVVKF